MGYRPSSFISLPFLLLCLYVNPFFFAAAVKWAAVVVMLKALVAMAVAVTVAVGAGEVFAAALTSGGGVDIGKRVGEI